MEVRTGVLRKDTFIYYQADFHDDIPAELLTHKITSQGFSRLLRSIRLPAGCPVLANRTELKIIHGNAIIRVFKLKSSFFFTVYSDGRQSLPRKIVFPDGAPPYPYPISLIA